MSQSAPSSITVSPISGTIGAEISGVDLTKPLDAATALAIHRALMDHCVVFFRDQELTLEQHKAFTRNFGELFMHPFFVSSDADPHVINIVRTPGDKKIVGEEWHSDTAFAEKPPMGSVLCAIELPPYGGDTMFASQYAAYEALSDGMKRMLHGVRALHSDRTTAGPRDTMNAARTTKVREDKPWTETVNFHPVVRTHPVTGRKALYVNRSTTMSLEDMTESESRPLLEFLYAHAVRPEFTCRFRWAPHSIAFWDNRCCQHLAVNDAGPFPRRMRRLQINGDRPV